MPARVSIYCTRLVATLDDETLRKAIGSDDLHMMAEGLEPPWGDDAAVDAMKKVLKIEGGRVFWNAAHRPLQVERYDGEALRTIVEERLATLPASTTPALVRLRDHLTATNMIIGIDMSLDAAQTLAGVLAEAIGYYYAVQNDGLLELYDTDWATPARKLLWRRT